MQSAIGKLKGRRNEGYAKKLFREVACLVDICEAVRARASITKSNLQDDCSVPSVDGPELHGLTMRILVRG